MRCQVAFRGDASGSTQQLRSLSARRVRAVITRATTNSAGGSEYEALQGVRVQSAADGADAELTALLGQPEDDELVLVPFLTHFGESH